MARKRPWSTRAASRRRDQSTLERQIWKHSYGLNLAWLLGLVSLSGFIGLHAAIMVLLIRHTLFTARDPTDQGFFEGAWKPWLIAASILGVIFMIGNGIGRIARSRLASKLTPTRCQRCPKCFYDLSARNRNDDRCPECGIDAPRRECVRQWCKLLRSGF